MFFLGKKRLSALLLACVLLVSAAGCTARNDGGSADTGDSTAYNKYSGLTEVKDADGNSIWVKIYEDARVNSYDPTAFNKENDRLQYRGSGFTTMQGIDVSAHQGEIDWKKVAASGVQFAMIRVCYRGWSQGEIKEDPYFKANIEGAIANGIRVGVYGFSQALTIEEAQAEAKFILDRIGGYQITLPICFDWENVPDEPEARSNNLDGKTLTDCAITFCDAINAAGYTAGIYIYKALAYYSYEMDRIQNYFLWMAELDDVPNYYYDFNMWQYSITGKVDGITSDVDLNLWLIPVKEDEGQSSAAGSTPPATGTASTPATGTTNAAGSTPTAAPEQAAQ